MRKMMRKNLVSRMAAAVSSGISCDQNLPSTWFFCHLWNRSEWLHACAEGYLVCLILGIDELQQEVATAGHPGGCVCLGDMAGLEDERLKEQG